MIDSLDGAQRHITRGWITGAVMTGVTFLASVTASAAFLAPDGLRYADAALAFLLTFGIWRRSRIAAVAMLILFVAVTVFKVASVGARPLFLLFAAAFSYFYVQAVRGTWAYHRLAANPAGRTTSGPERAA